MTANAMIHATVKLLNGDLLEIEHKPSKGFNQFVRQIYDACPDIPYGCLVLKRMKEDDEEKYPDGEDEKEVQEVFDNDVLFAFVDTSRIRPHLERGGDMCMPSSDEKERPAKLILLRVQFFSTKEYNADWDEPLCYSNVELFFNISKNAFALKHTFREPFPVESSSYISEGLTPPYRPTDQTIWFDNPIDCLKSVENPRFPVDQDTLDSISRQIELELEEDDDDNDYDDRYDDYDDQRAMEFERWVHENDY